MNKKDLNLLKSNYAKLIVCRGLNIPKNRYVIIEADIEDPDFVSMLVEECYKIGAKKVSIKWTYGPLTRLQFEKMSLKEISTLYDYQKEKIRFDINNDVSHIYLESDDPDLLDGVDSRKITAKRLTVRQFENTIRKNESFAPFVIASIPSKAWAKKIFPKLNVEQALLKMWEVIFKICHVNKADPFKEWDKHCKAIDERAKWLNSLNIESLHYTNKLGTDLVVGLTDKYKYAATADFDNKTKRKYYSNIPTEECFVAPHKDKVNGIVYASMPLCANGQLIEGIVLKFKNGKVVEAHAKRNEKTLKAIIAADKGSCYLGEAALVPYTSPIRQSGILFYSTLYDENAACHFALGNAYAYTYQGYEKMSKKELEKVGINYSSIHEDFMIGTKDLNIVATLKNGRKISIFKNGVWAK